MTFTIIDVSNIYLARQYDLISQETFLKLHKKLNKDPKANAVDIDVPNRDSRDRDRGGDNAPADLDAVLKESPNDQR